MALSKELINPFPAAAPFGWIQWKGTQVCMDVHCPNCGLGHIDAEFAYFLLCKGCGTTYAVNGHVQLIPIDASQAGDVNVVEIEDMGED